MQYILKFLFPWVLLLNEKKWWWLLILLINLFSLGLIAELLLSSSGSLYPEMFYATWFFIEDILFNGDWIVWIFILWSITVRVLSIWYIQYENLYMLKILSVIVFWVLCISSTILLVFGQTMSAMIDWIKTYRYSTSLTQEHVTLWNTLDWANLLAYDAIYNRKWNGIHLVWIQMEYFNDDIYESVYSLLLVKRSLRWYIPLRIEYYSFNEPVTIVSFEADIYSSDQESLIGNLGSYAYDRFLQEKAIWVIYKKYTNEFMMWISDVLQVPAYNDNWISNYDLDIIEWTAEKSLLDWKPQTIQWNIIKIKENNIYQNQWERYTRKKVWVLEVVMQYSNWEILIIDYEVTNLIYNETTT